MNRKMFLIAVAIVFSFSLAFRICADQFDTIHALKIQRTIAVDNFWSDSRMSMVSIEDVTYVPIREICDLLNIGVEWKEENNEIALNTDKGLYESEQIEAGYYGINGWAGRVVDGIEISKETAIALADDVFRQIHGEKFLNETVITSVRETNNGGLYPVENGKFYSVCRALDIEDLEGGCWSVIIDKSNGKVLRVVAGE